MSMNKVVFILGMAAAAITAEALGIDSLAGIFGFIVVLSLFT